MKDSMKSIVVSKLANLIEEFNEQQLEQFLKNDAEIKIVIKPFKVQKEQVDYSDTAEHYLEQLRTVNERSQGSEMLSPLTKPLLHCLAKQLNLSVDTSTPKNKLIERIVERSIGLRLRQEAFAQLT